ncbi:polyphosphate polymerase domain-containing protein [Saccharothrix sp. S26]|uniref:polyphosphate polymerase domain-containing protein n=1 Tax=Saccharothrix sp. S26 TaxID=2907215 RepID=UPI001F380337|nr:polyphosphate polymerase domain-containing protein [Saccharothrix sp. S26]MCE7001052.1 polyphosphate polymerase domain-containing protein [Saccharothrix sp. S26]
MTTTTTSVPALARMAPVGLAELIERAALQTRVDRKYVVPAEALPHLLEQLVPHARVLDIDGGRAFRYRSVYFDTPGLVSYHGAAYRRRRRFKVRTRTYLDSGECWLEVKISGARGSITKHRLPYHPDDRDTVHPGRRFVEEALARESIAPDDGSLDPVLVTDYQRTTLLLPESASRVTVDTELSWRHHDRALRLSGLAVIETKTASAASPVDRMLWQRGVRPARISKYATGLAALRLDLPDAPWRRTLRRHFRATTPSVGPVPTTPSHRPEQEASCV